MIDLRSDTVTKPTREMLAAIAAAPVGDDVFGEDPTVNRLEERVAEYLGMEAALFTPTGTMANQIAVRLHCQPCDEILCDPQSHVVLWEAGGPAALSGVTLHPVEPNANGLFTPKALEQVLRPDDMHSTRSRLLWLENTHNRRGGTIYPVEEYEALAQWAKRKNLLVHLDGARLWNAVVASGIPAPRWAAAVDTVSVCFSKGLGAPVGSALAGSRERIRQARRIRKLFGGAMRQAGVVAATCLYAMDHNIDRLAEDHANAQILADAIRRTKGLNLQPPGVTTNLVWFETSDPTVSARLVAERLHAQGVAVSALGLGTIRACTHLGVTRADCERAAELIRKHAMG